MPLTDRTTQHGVAPPAFDVVACGVDTVSVSWKPRTDDDDWWERVAGRLRAGWIDHKAGMPVPGVKQPECEMRRSKLGGYVSRQSIATGGRLMVWPAARRVAVEGRLTSLLPNSADRLYVPDLIEDAAARAAVHLEWLGLLDGGEPCFLRRLDLATDVEFSDRTAGRALLDAVARAKPATGCKLTIWTAGHGAETVSLYEFSGKRRELVGRIYDRGDKTGDRPHGELVRIERQLRWQGADCPTLETALGSSWTGEALHWTQKMRAEKVGAVALDEHERLLRLIEDGSVPTQQGLRLLGSLFVMQRRDPFAWWKFRGKNGPATRRKHRGELEALGLLSPSPAVEVPCLAAVLDSAHEKWDALAAN